MADRLVADENDSGLLRRDVDMGDGTFAERVVTVNTLASPEFYLGRQFRTFFEFSTANGNAIPTGQRILIRATIAVDTILTLAGLALDSGAVRIRSFVGGTPTGTFSVPLPAIRSNAMASVPAYTALDSYAATPPGLPAAVDITGGVLADVIRARTAGQNVSTASVAATEGGERGLPVGVVYILIESTGTTDAAEGVIRFRWVEVP